MSEPDDSVERFERSIAHALAEELVLRLFVAGMTPRSLKAIAELNALAVERLGPRCSLEVIDISQQPERAVSDQIIAVPCLLKERPRPHKRVLGSLSDHDEVLRALNYAP